MRIKNIFGLGLASLIGMTTAANAAIITLETVTPSMGNYIWSYQGTIGPDEGVRAGDKLVIYDFAGYVPGSIFSTSPSIITSTELSTMGLIAPGQTDDVTLVNLVFTYTGPDFRNIDGPYPPFDFNGLGAMSIYQTIRLDAFTTYTTKNNPDNAENTVVTTLGVTSVPAMVPEPASWAMMIGGFGLVGAMARRRRLGTVPA